MMDKDGTVPVICSLGGEIVPKYGKFVYEGGTTSFLRVHRTINFADLLYRVKENYRPTVISTIKYRYPGAELDCPLVLITKDKDVSDMMQEYSCRMAAPIQLYAFASQGSFHEPRQNRDNETIQSTRSILQKSEITSISHMVDAYRQDGDGTIFSHWNGEASHMVNSSGQNLDSVTLQARRRTFHENTETNTSSQMMLDDGFSLSDLDPWINFHEENTPTGGFETRIGPQPQVVDTDNCGLNNTLKKDLSLSEGQEFRTADAFDMALREHAIRSNFEYKPIRGDQRRIVKTCIKDGCPWHIHASKVPGGLSFRIETLVSNHAHETTKLATHHQASEKWIANFIRGQVRKHLYSKPNDIVEDINHVYGIEVSYYKARRGKDLALKEVHIGATVSDFATYCNELEKTNPRSIVTLGFPSYGLLGIFIAYHATIRGFQNACRPIITLYSRNIGGDYPHVWLYATGLDAGYNSFLVAYALVESSNQEMWTWFCDQLALMLVGTPKLTIITVKQENSSEAVYLSFPDACHRYCCKSLREDFNQKFKDENLDPLFLETINAESEGDFRCLMDKISSHSPEAQKWINEISPSPKYWAVSFFDGQQDCDHNHPIFEEFDIWRDNRNAMSSSIISMLMRFHAKMREIFLRNQVEESSDEAFLTPYAITRLGRVNSRANLFSFSIERHLETQFYVKSNVDSIHFVDLLERRCTCRIWQLHKFPCCHAVAAISWLGSNVSDYCEHYTVAKCREAYSEFIHPIPDDHHHPKDTPITTRAKKRTYSKRE